MKPARDAWHRELTSYHWFVLAICTLGWLFDCLDQQLFALARKPAASRDLLGLGVPDRYMAPSEFSAP